MATADDIMDDVRLNAIHDAHLEANEPHWGSCPLCGSNEDFDFEDDDNDPGPVSCVGPLGLRVLKEQCSSCIFRPGNLMNLNSGRLKDMTDSVIASQTYVICHQTLDQELGAACRGSYDKVPTRVTVTATELGFIEFVDAPITESELRVLDGNR